MIKAIVTAARPDGTFDEVGMNNRTVVGPYRRDFYIWRAARAYGRGRPFRIEFFRGDRIYGNPYKIEYGKGW
jgi:hypothetical protein